MPDDIQFNVNWSEVARRAVAQGKMRQGESIPLITRHQMCAYENGGLGAYYHRGERIKLLWPTFQWHRWTERRLNGICKYPWVTWLGPASSGKSTEAAIFALEYWLQAPDRTAVIVCSTSVSMLRMRIWSEIAKYHGQLPRNYGNVGELIDSKTLIRWKAGNDRNGIFGMAVEEGPTEQIVNNLIGIKADRVMLILDEMQGVREAIMKATANLVSNPVFTFLGMGNPDSFTNPLGRESEPVGGWDTVVAGETAEWETHGGPTPGRGLCQFFDGRNSPADDSPAESKRLYWLMNKEKREGILKGCRNNENDPSYWQMGIGWPPPMGITSTVLDAATIIKFHCRKKAVWTHGFFQWASLDPSFEGGDKKVLTIGKCGETEYEGPRRWVIETTEQIEVPMNAKSTVPIHYQIVYWVRDELTRRNISPSFFGTDSSGEGGGLLAIFRAEWGAVIGIEFGGSPSESPIATKPGKTAREEYTNRSAELNMNVREFALSNGLRGLPERAEVQFCARRTALKNKKQWVEPKTISKAGSSEKGFKQRMGYSPDHADSVCVGVAVCKEHGAVPAMTDEVREAATDPTAWNDVARKTDSEFSEDNYLHAAEYIP